MTSPHLDSTHGQQRRAWHDITALGQYTQSDDVWRCMTLPPLDSTHDRTTSGVTCQYRLWATHMVERRRAWHGITSFGQRTRSDDIGRYMPSLPLESTHGRTKSGVACHHHFWATHTVELRRAWHAIIAYGQHKLSNDIGRDMPSPPLESTHGQTTSGVACHHHLWEAHTVERRSAVHDIIAVGLAHTVERR